MNHVLPNLCLGCSEILSVSPTHEETLQGIQHSDVRNSYFHSLIQSTDSTVFFYLDLMERKKKQTKQTKQTATTTTTTNRPPSWRPPGPELYSRLTAFMATCKSSRSTGGANCSAKPQCSTASASRASRSEARASKTRALQCASGACTPTVKEGSGVASDPFEGVLQK